MSVVHTALGQCLKKTLDLHPTLNYTVARFPNDEQKGAGSWFTAYVYLNTLYDSQRIYAEVTLCKDTPEPEFIVHSAIRSHETFMRTNLGWSFKTFRDLDSALSYAEFKLNGER